jgi:thiol-disulfide isomerase/thioredoxin
MAEDSETTMASVEKGATGTSAPATSTPATSATESRSSSIRAALVVVALAAGFALIPRTTRGCEGSLGTNEVAPDFEARLVANAENVGPLTGVESGSGQAGAGPAKLELRSLRGRPVVLDFWATWCGPCQAEAPIVNAIAERYKDRGLAVIGVNTSDEEGLAAHFVKKKGLSFPIVYDEGNAIARKYRVSNLPTLIVVSKTGKIVAVRHGVTSDIALDDLVRRHL